MIKNPYANAGNTGNVNSSPGLGKSPGKGHGNPLQYSCLKNPMARGAWWATVHGEPEEPGGLQSMGSQRNLAGYIQSVGSQRLDSTEHTYTTAGYGLYQI